MTTYKIGLMSNDTHKIVATLHGSETEDRNLAYENAIRYNQDLDHRPDHCRYVVVELPDKPTGTFRCLACGRTWQGHELYQDPTKTITTWTCGDLTCGAIVEPVPPANKKGDTNA
ncbi:MAG TPA: hypothetical protein VMX14_13210 [Anaerolineae bacterium]|nr:hypothetical protein [Anaerolineae bacterium]